MGAGILRAVEDNKMVLNHANYTVLNDEKRNCPMQ